MEIDVLATVHCSRPDVISMELELFVITASAYCNHSCLAVTRHKWQAPCATCTSQWLDAHKNEATVIYRCMQITHDIEGMEFAKSNFTRDVQSNLQLNLGPKSLQHAQCHASKRIPFTREHGVLRHQLLQILRRKQLALMPARPQLIFPRWRC